MPKRIHHLEIESSAAPVVEITGEGSATYVWLNRGFKPVKTIRVSKWPVLNIDVGENNVVIGVEAIGFIEFTVTSVLKAAGLSVPKAVAERARYVYGSPEREAVTA